MGRFLGGVPWTLERTTNVCLQRPTIMALFALAALAVMNSPHDLLFWAFWGLKSAERTAELVDEVIREYRFHPHPNQS